MKIRNKMKSRKITQKDKSLKRWTIKEKRTLDRSKRHTSDLMEVSERGERNQRSFEEQDKLKESTG